MQSSSSNNNNYNNPANTQFSFSSDNNGIYAVAWCVSLGIVVLLWCFEQLLYRLTAFATKSDIKLQVSGFRLRARYCEQRRQTTANEENRCSLCNSSNSNNSDTDDDDDDDDYLPPKSTVSLPFCVRQFSTSTITLMKDKLEKLDDDQDDDVDDDDKNDDDDNSDGSERKEEGKDGME